MMNIGPRKKGIVLKRQKRQEKIWLSSVGMKFTGRQDGKTVLMGPTTPFRTMVCYKEGSLPTAAGKCLWR